MSGLDPLAALAAQVVANAEAAMEQATLDLGAVVAEIRAQVSVGDVVVAAVLPPQDGADRISFLGQTVNAQLPPGINPGETIALQVTGFTNTAILVQNLGVADPENPPLPVQTQAAPAGASNAQSAVLSTTPQVPGATAQSPPASAGTSQAQTVPSQTQATPPQTQAPGAVPLASAAGTTPLAPPPAVFVAASIRESVPPAVPEPVGPAAAPGDLEVRIAVTRAGNAPPPIAPSAASPARPAPVPAQRSAPPAPSLRISLPPIITQRGLPVTPRPGAPAPQTAAEETTATTTAVKSQVSGSAEAALLRNLRVPVTPATIDAARGIGNAAQTVTNTFQKLEALLANVTQDDRITALRSALSFVGRIDLRNVRAMPEQIASFVANVVDGAESKIAQIVRAWSAAQTATDSTNAAPQAQTPAGQQVNQTAQSATAVEAHVAERMVALDHDVKTAILALIENPPDNSTPQVATALRAALTATNALQLNVLSAKSSDASMFTIPLPAYFYDGGKPAQIQISRDAPSAKNSMDADNFHVAFILDTKSLGTVAIDLQAVGRSVTVDVKTQASAFADRFRGTLSDLRSRLEQLHYRVAGIGAGVAATPAAAVPEAQPESVTEGPPANLDMRA